MNSQRCQPFLRLKFYILLPKVCAQTLHISCRVKPDKFIRLPPLHCFSNIHPRLLCSSFFIQLASVSVSEIYVFLLLFTNVRRRGIGREKFVWELLSYGIAAPPSGTWWGPGYRLSGGGQGCDLRGVNSSVGDICVY